ncbi:MAG: glycoside hydrolase family 2 TIM barrel-domain containing protein [Cyclobacteriaceae bacterium]
MVRFTLFILQVLTLIGFATAQTTLLNEGWQFSREGNAAESVSIPHTWNQSDPYDDVPGYYRGTGIYSRDLTVSSSSVDRNLFLKFEAVNQEASVFVGDKLVKKHLGGYTAFHANLTGHVKAGVNKIRVEVSNEHNPDLVPLKGDFNFYGGIYRDVWLEEENEVYFSKTEFGNDAVYLTPTTDGSSHALNVKGTVSNSGKPKSSVLIQIRLESPEGDELINTTKKLSISGESAVFDFDFEKLQGIDLWSTTEPNLYLAEIRILDRKSAEVLDSYSHQIGFRHFRFDADSGFFLNENHVKLIGANRHQDFAGLGNALSDDFHRRDVRLLKEMGANFFRPAHYPQDVAVLREADRLGLVVTMEIPLDHDMTDTEVFKENSRYMMQEMIHQYYNHPSIVIWAYMNEMFLGRNLKHDEKKIDQIVTFSRELDSLTRKEDPTRLTLIPNHGDFNIYHQTGLTDVSQIIGWNLYYGWYEPSFSGLTDYLTNAHSKVADKPMIITEYGAGADPRIRSLNPERFDFSIDWQFNYHLEDLRQFDDLPFLAGAAVWNLCDFGAEHRPDAVPHINSKGLMIHDRQPKDTYFLYQAWLSRKSVIQILPTLFPVLPKSLGEDTLFWPIKVVSNFEKAVITVNGNEFPPKEIEDGYAEWFVPLIGDRLYIEATGFKENESITTSTTYSLSPKLNINLGANYYFYDPTLNELWVPDQAYTAGQKYGRIGGEEYRPRNRGIGTDHPISLTELDPIYQTQSQGLSGYKLEVEKGKYEVTALLSKLTEVQGMQTISINGAEREIIDLGAIQQFVPVTKKYLVGTDQNIELTLENGSGQTVLNGIKIVKID